jgi:uncharacterized protein (DUF983 family)
MVYPEVPRQPASISRIVFRQKCPYCGRGPAFRSLFEVRDKCEVCGYVLNRGNPAYFSGAIVINFLLGAGGTLALMLLVIVATWPNVPWKVVGYAVPVAVVVSVLLLNPISKAILMAVDVRMRPITEDELVEGSHEESRVRPHGS